MLDATAVQPTTTRCALAIRAAIPPCIDEIERELTTLAAHLNAGNYRFLKLLAEFERRGGHVGWQIASCAHWLAWKCGIGLVAAREKVRVARALEGLPRLGDAMRRGVLSYCKIRALTRIATAENEDYLLSIAEVGTVTHVEKTVRLYRKSERAAELQAENGRYAERSLSCHFDEDGSFVINGAACAGAGGAGHEGVAGGGRCAARGGARFT